MEDMQGIEHFRAYTNKAAPQGIDRSRKRENHSDYNRAEGGSIMGIPRMRTLPEAVAMLREQDSKTAVTLTALRRMAKRGELPVIMIASRRLVNFDTLLEILTNPGAGSSPAPIESGQIRRIG